ncbi:WD40 repeat-like protein [Aureobasidium sp. EXF-3400]|nr:WD40 repeat-like protein [Aureobasidium sp. EXF-12344]KAI4783283.1 WD40 repeat-like protein [Aureobasidium sp. EXF-3400]
MASARLEYIAAGGNRHPCAADWTEELLAYGSGHNIAIWKPENNDHKGVETLLTAHTDIVNAVKLFRDSASGKRILISGSADKTICIWIEKTDGKFELVKSLTEHTASINALGVLPEDGVFATGAADATLKIWKLRVTETAEVEVDLIQSITLAPRYFPLAIALAKLQSGQLIIAVGGTMANIQIYMQNKDTFLLAAKLTGHEAWVRALDFIRESSKPDSDFLLASASQDKYTRLWRFHAGEELPEVAAAASDPAMTVFGRSLSNKAHWIGEGDSRHSITFEALLIGHEDWIYTARWFTKTAQDAAPQLLTASADNSLAMWERDADGFWTCATRLGEISAQKGSTTATGSTGGFWIGLWSPSGNKVVSLGRTGSWRAWSYNSTEDRWLRELGISGHVRAVKDIAWSNDGTQLMSTSTDQTTRLFGQWKRDNTSTWHEMSRPQIHGYDLNCLSAIGATQFISGADEKLLRVFNKPKAVAHLLAKLSGSTEDASDADLPDAANIPVLGLSNKAINALTPEEEATAESTEETQITKSTLDLSHPPFEDHLARHTLFPELEKLYGHGYEISCVAASHDGSLVATACRASSIDHAVIRLYETKEWREVKPALTAHSLTVTCLAFSADDNYLLSVGRDRQWALFSRSAAASSTYELTASNPKGHSRMILSCSWAGATASNIFATGGRDKNVKIWGVQASETTTADLKLTIPTSAPATSVVFYTGALSTPDTVVLAAGTENGEISVWCISTQDWSVKAEVKIEKNMQPSGAINALRWRPDGKTEEGQQKMQLAVASEDLSVRLFELQGLI